MTRVTIYCTITRVGVLEVFTQHQVSGHKFVLTAKDDTGIQSITVFDHTRDYHCSLYEGQSILLENVHTSGKLQKLRMFFICMSDKLTLQFGNQT